MKVISLWQPWASLMASGAKKIETRHWEPRGLRAGQEVAIHAARHWTTDERELCADDPFFKRYLQLAERRGLWNFDSPPLGCVVAIARFDRFESTTALLRRVSKHELAFGDYGPARFGWVFSDVRPLTPPVPLRGQQGIFEWNPDAPEMPPIRPQLIQPGATRVVHCRKDAFDCYVGRPMPRYPELRSVGWGNPFRDGVDTPQGRQSAIDRYRDWLMKQPALLARLPELRGKRLGCWCAPKGGLPGNLHGRVCHGEVLAALADEVALTGEAPAPPVIHAERSGAWQESLWTEATP